MNIFIALLVLSVLIFLHELGHFTAARFFGVQVDVFSIGFGKRLWSKKIGKTEWSISSIPLGGYVKMKGQDDSNPSKMNYDIDSYTSKKPWQRIIILLAGPFANFLTAFILYILISILGIPKFQTYIHSIAKESPAMHVGLHVKDKILQINGISVHYWSEIGPLINKKNKQVSLLIERNHTQISINLIPQIIDDKNMFGEPIHRKIIGISPILTPIFVHYGFIDSITYAYNETIQSSLMIFKSIQKLLSGAISSDNLGGVITIVDVTAKASSAGLIALFGFTALISVNLGVLNLLPIPALDGGHIMFNLYEILARRKPNEQIMIYITMLGWILLISLMLLGLYNDINRLWSK